MWIVILNWLRENSIETLGTIIGLIYLWLSVKQNIWLWLFGIISSALYIYVFFVARLYALTSLQVYYVIVSFYGWFHWLYGNKTEGQPGKKLPIGRITVKQASLLFGITVLLNIIFYFVLKYFTNSDQPFWDSFSTAVSIIATWMLARKVLEHWLVWIVVDAVMAVLYFEKQLYPTVILYSTYTILAILGFIEWKKDFKQQEVAG
jgi:nicotinamide mononucleotide transporter